MALTLPPEHLPQSGPQSMETQAGEGQLESGALDEGWLTPMCVHMHERSFSHTYHTHSFRMCMCARARARTRPSERGQRVGEVKKTGKDRGN